MVNKAQKVHIKVVEDSEVVGNTELRFRFMTACGLLPYDCNLVMTDNLEEATCKHCLRKWRDRGESETITVLKLGEYKK